MIDKNKLLEFLLEARKHTYAGGEGKATAVFSGSYQLEYRTGDWLYRDIYYSGKNNGLFMGLETIYYQKEPIWSMSYFGDSGEMTEEEIDSVLKQALLDKWKETRLWKKVEWQKEDYKYICQSDFEGAIDKMAGMEEILKKDRQIYSFFYGGGIIGSQ